MLLNISFLNGFYAIPLQDKILSDVIVNEKKDRINHKFPQMMGQQMEREKRRKVVFYGDSNTYGYDPADVYNMRFPENKRWTTIIAGRFISDMEVIPQGMNGRKIPDLRYDKPYLKRMIDTINDNGIFCTMLGTNDLLEAAEHGAERAIRKMEAFLEYLLTCLNSRQILIIAPPYIGSARIPDPLYQKFYSESVRMNNAFRRMAEERKMWFADASAWNIELSFDQVHFSERGHLIFAGRLAEMLELMIRSDYGGRG